jgi:hypothetical protein
MATDLVPTRPTEAESPTSLTVAKTSEDRSTAFRAVEGGTQLHSGAQLLVEAYSALWIVLFLLVLISWRRQRGLEARIAEIEVRLEEARTGAALEARAPHPTA